MGAKQNKSILTIVLVIIAIITISGCTVPNDEPPVGELSETEYLNFSSERSEKISNLSGEFVEDLEDYIDRRITREELDSKERERKIEYENILSELEQVTPPEEYKEFHDYWIRSMEYAILSSEYTIKWAKTGDDGLLDRSIDYMTLRREYLDKAIDTMP